MKLKLLCFVSVIIFTTFKSGKAAYLGCQQSTIPCYEAAEYCIPYAVKDVMEVCKINPKHCFKDGNGNIITYSPDFYEYITLSNKAGFRVCVKLNEI